MSPEHDQLYRKIVEFSFDGPGPVTQAFVDRLAHENGWSRMFAERAIREYRRFVFLAMVAGQPVCPSEQVDQVWHLHLTYTRSYWDRFCKEVLGRPLHHDPTRGGSNEAAKHHRMYAETLNAYRRCFNEEPPSDVWPESTIRFGDDLNVVRVNTRRNWIISKSAVRRSIAAVFLFVFLVGFVSGCVAPVVAADWNPFEFKNAEFLWFYPVLYVGFLIAAIIWRQHYRGPDFAENDEEPKLDLYETAYLRGYEYRVAQTALIRLHSMGCISVDNEGKMTITGPLPEESDEVEVAVYAALAGQETKKEAMKAVHQAVRGLIPERFARLAELGLIPTPPSRGILNPLLLRARN